MYQQRFNKENLFWNYTPIDIGTFTINAIIQNEQNNIIATATLIIEPHTVFGNINTNNNINSFIINNNIIKPPKYKSEEDHLIEYNKSKVSS